jgi:SAM-dependent methyltransferase
VSASLTHITTAFDLLRCPECQHQLVLPAGELKCTGCAAVYPIRAGIPRFVATPAGEIAKRTQASFGYEWSEFNDWQPSGATNFQQYFSDFDLSWLGGRTVLDAGCGIGRHARHIAQYAGRVVAMDFSQAIDYAARNTADLSNVTCIQGDITRPPVADEAFDLVYSLGVLHHIANAESAARRLLAKVKPGGRLRIYLYWKRHGLSAIALRAVDRMRQVTTRMPFPVLKAFCWILSVKLWLGVVLPYRALSACAIRWHEKWPLAVYARYPFGVIYNDQFDRFSAPIEQRWSEDEVRRLMARLGLCDVRVVPSFGWIAEGTKPSR